MKKLQPENTEYEKQCFIKMLSMMEKPIVKPLMETRIAFDSHTEKCRLNRVLNSQRNSQRRLQRNSWIGSESIKSESKAPKRSTSADSSKKARISCDVSNLKVVGTKTNFNPMNTRASTPESSELMSLTKVQIKKTLLKSQECSLKPEQPSKSRLSRSRQILKELQRQLRPKEHVLENRGQAKKKSSPYVVFKQRNLHEMHNLVLELDNNLSFGSNDHQENTTASTHNGCATKNSSSSLNNIHLDIDLLNLEDKPVIGKGTYATVYKCQLHGTDIAVKVFQPNSNLTSEMLTRRWKTEGELMMKLRHPHIVQLVGASQNPADHISILAFEFLESGSLNHYIHQVIGGKLDHGSFFSIARDVALALNYLHKQQPKPIIHMDVKSANILLDAYLRAKVADLGLAKYAQETIDEDYDLKGLELSGPRGTPAWMAPEMLENLKVSTATDIYGLGLILWEMKSGERPFVNLTLEEVCTAIKEGHKPTMPSDVTDDLRALMTACWCTDPRQRPNCEEVLSKLNQMSFPNNHWQALFGNSPLIDTPIDENQDDDDDEDLEPRPLSIITRSYSAPAPVLAPAPTPPVPPPPPPPPDLIMPKPNLTLPKRGEISKPQPGYSVTPEEIQKRLYSLKKISPEDEEEVEAENPSGLADLMRKVMVNRRETGWCDSSSQSSGCISRNGGKLATVNSSWDDL